MPAPPRNIIFLFLAAITERGKNFIEASKTRSARKT